MDNFELNIELEFCAAHVLTGHKGKCSNLHGHNYKVDVCVSGQELDSLGLLIDFADLKKIVNEVVEGIDHKYINELDHKPFLEGKTSAEHISKFIFEQVEAKLDKSVTLEYVKLYETSKYSVKFSKKR